MKRTEDIDTEGLLDSYVKAAQGYIDARTARGANRHHGVGERVVQELQRRGEDRQILMLLSHPSPAVKLWAAIDSLRIEPDSAQQVLQALAKSTNPRISIDAADALDNFRKGDAAT